MSFFTKIQDFFWKNSRFFLKKFKIFLEKFMIFLEKLKIFLEKFKSFCEKFKNFLAESVTLCLCLVSPKISPGFLSSSSSFIIIWLFSNLKTALYMYNVFKYQVPKLQFL